jgi:hypothetical protein
MVESIGICVIGKFVKFVKLCIVAQDQELAKTAMEALYQPIAALLTEASGTSCLWRG